MALTQDTVSGFIGGVSQQPDKMMFPNQSKKLINMSPEPVVGLCKRKPTEHVARLMDALTIHPYTHTIIKEDEKYKVYLTGTGIKVFDLNGNEKTVNSTDYSYITTDNPLKNLTASTIADYTFITNKTVKAALKNDKYPNPYPSAALIFVKQGNYSIDYIVKVNGTNVATKTTSDSSISDHRTDTICKALYDGMVSKLGTTDWRITKLNSTILLERLDGTDFSIQTSDSNSDRNLYSFHKETQQVTDLPVVAPDGFILKITGDDGDTSDDYYVQFTVTDGSTFGKGTWKECCSPDMQYKVDGATMPHVLVREANGTFTFKEADWTDRKAGDEDTAKTPSIFGNTIQEVFTYKGRLGFIAGDRSLYTDVDDIFSLFKRTVMTSLDTDPIDIGSNSKMVLLKHSLAYNEDLYVFSPTSIFTITSGDVFSNSTVGIDLTMEYPCSTLCKPIGIGGSALFAYDNGDYSGLYEIYVASTYQTAARCITEEVPCYIPSGLHKMTSNVENNVVCLLSYKDRKSIYTYNYYYTSEQKAQSAWSKWVFNGDILGIEFIEHYLYITIQYEDGVYLERINISPKQTEKDLNFLFHIDRKTHITDITANGKYIHFALPYKPSADITILDKQGFPVKFAIEGNIVTIKGKYDELIIGNTYSSNWEWGTIYKKQQTQTGAKTVEGVLMLKDIMLSYLDTGYFKAIVLPKYSTMNKSEYTFTGVVLGTDSAQLSLITPHSDTFLIPVMAKNEDISIEVVNDSYLPSTFASMVWLGELNVRGQ